MSTLERFIRRAILVVLMLVLPPAAVIGWLLWFHQAYRGFDSYNCAVNGQPGHHPGTLALGIALICASIISTAPKWARITYAIAIGLAALDALLSLGLIGLLYSLISSACG